MLSPRQARDKEELLELCTDYFDVSSAPLQLNHDYLRHITASNLSHKARKLLVWFTEHIVRRNFVVTNTQQLASVIEDSKHLSRYLKELEDMRLLYTANTQGQTRLIEIHPGLVFKGWNQRREQYLEQWTGTKPIYLN